MALCVEPVTVAVVLGACTPDAVLGLKIMASPVPPLSVVYPDVVGAPYTLFVLLLL
jgi:hypothetical protein